MWKFDCWRFNLGCLQDAYDYRKCSVRKRGRCANKACLAGHVGDTVLSFGSEGNCLKLLCCLMEPRVEPGHEPGLLWRPRTLLCRGCLFLFLGQELVLSPASLHSWIVRGRGRQRSGWRQKRPHLHVELGHAVPMPSLEGACQDSLYSSQWSFLLSLCTREHNTHHHVVNAQAP